MNVKLYSLDTNYKLSDGSVYKKIDMKTKIIDEALSDPPDPFRDPSLITARKTSTSALLMTIFVLSTFLAGVSFSSSTFKEDYLNSKDTITSHSIVAINSLVFIVSLVTDMFLVHKFSCKWELQIVLFALFGAYICLMKATIPQAALPLFMISFPFLLIAAVGDAWVNDAVSSQYDIS